jgi:hypothetical protein
MKYFFSLLIIISQCFVVNGLEIFSPNTPIFVEKKDLDQKRSDKNNKYLNPRCDSCFFYHLDLDYPGMEDVKSAAAIGDYAKAKAAYLEFRKYKSKPKWHINPNNKPMKASMVTDINGDRVINRIIGANMGAPEVYLGKDINWEFNPVDSLQPHFTKEWTWQNLNRGRMWSTLGEAYWNTLDEKYAKEWVAIQEDWINDNPVPLDADPGATLTWRTIEAGIRISRWMNAYYSFLHSPSFTPEAHATFVKGIIEHGQRLERVTTEQPERSSNWVTMECNGLGTIGILFPELAFSDHFFEAAIRKMDVELTNQVYPDGTQIELTSGYHQVSRENFMKLARFAIFNNVSLPDKYMEKLKKMYWFNLKMMDPLGNLPPFNDSRITHVLASLEEAYDIWKDDEFLFGATLGKEGKKPDFDSYYLDWAGYYIMRSGWEINDNCLYFDAGPLGHGHEHEDMLNLYLYSQGEILLTEAGNFTYDASKWRRYAISTMGHNTIVVNGKEQHRRGYPGGRVVKEPIPNPWVTTPLFDFGRGVYSSGYQENVYKPVAYRPREYSGPRDTSVWHTRNVIFLKPYYYLVVDFLDGQGDHRYDALFHLNAPDALIIDSSQSVHTLRDGNIQLGLYPMNTENMTVRMVKGQEDPVLGWIPSQKEPIPTVVFTKNEEAPATFSTLLYPYSKEQPNISYKEIMSQQKSAWGRLINSPYETIALILKKEDQVSSWISQTEMVPEFSTDASVVVIRRPHRKNDNFYGFNAISYFRGDDVQFTLGETSSLVFVIKAANIYEWYNPTEQEIDVNMTAPFARKLKLPAGKWIQMDAEGSREIGDINPLF